MDTPDTSLVDVPKSDLGLVAGVAKGMVKGAELNASPVPETSSVPGVNQQAILTGIANAKKSLQALDINPNEFEPSFLQSMGAYFRDINPVASAASSNSLAETLFPSPAPKAMNPDEVVNRATQDNLSPHLSVFEGVDNEAEYAARKADLLRELQDKQIMAATSGLTGLGLSLAAGILDPTNLIPGSIGFKAGAKGVTLGKALVGVEASALLQSGIDETILRSSQVTRDGTDTLENVGGSLILGGMLGAGLHSWAHREIGFESLDRIGERLRNTVADISEGSPRLKSAGAAGVSTYERMQSELERFRPVGSLGANESLRALGNIKGVVGDGLRIPMLDLDGSLSPAALDARAKLVYTPSISQGDAAGILAHEGSPVVAFTRDFRDDLAKAAEQGEGLYKQSRNDFKNFADFDQQVSLALVDPTYKAKAHTAVVQTADAHRAIYGKILDDLVEARVLPPEVKTKYGDTYFPLIFDANSIRAKPDEFKQMIADGFERVFKQDGADGLRERAGRAAANEQAQADIVGITAKRPVFDATTGLPVMNPKTGAQKQSTVVLKEGEQLQRQRITKEQHKLEMDRIAEERTLSLAFHDDKTREAVSGVRQVYRDYENQLIDEASGLLDRIQSPASTLDRNEKVRIEDVRQKVADHKRQSGKQVSDLRTIYDDLLNSANRDAEALKKRIKDSPETQARKDQMRDRLDRMVEARTKALIGERDTEIGKLQSALDRQRQSLERALQAEGPSASEIIGQINAINAEQARQLKALSAEREKAIEGIKTQRRTEKQDIAARFKAEEEDAKRIRDANLVDARQQAKDRLAEEQVSIRAGLEDKLQWTRGGELDNAKIKEGAKSLAQRWYDSATGWNRDLLDHELEGFAHFLKKRRSPVPHADLINAGFAKSQSYSVLDEYVRKAGTDAAVAKTFKKQVREAGPDGKVTPESELIDIGDIRLGSTLKDIENDYANIRDEYFKTPDFKAKEDALAKKYEKLTEGKSDAELKALADQYNEELGKIKSDVERKLADRRERDKQNVLSILDGIRGSHGAGTVSRNAQQIAEVVGAFNHLRLMGQDVVSSLTDPIKIAIANGFANTVQGFMMTNAQGFTPLWRRASAADKDLARAGAAASELVLNGRLSAIADVSNPHKVNGGAVDFMRRATSIFSTHLSRITYWNAFWKQTQENASMFALGQWAYRGWDNLGASQKALLTNLRINKDGLELIRQAHENQAGQKWYRSNDMFPMLAHETWEDAEASRLVRHALGEELNNNIVTPQGYDRMNFTQSPTGRLIWQFRQYMISNQMRFVGRQLQLASLDTEKAVGLAAGFAGLVTAGALVDFLKHAIGTTTATGDNIDRNRGAVQRQVDEWRDTPGLALYNALDRSDTLGAVMEGSNIMDKTFGSPLKWALTRFDDEHKLKDAGRFANRSAIDAVAGPTAGLANDLLINVPQSVKHFTQSAWTGQNKFTRGDYRTARRMFPGENTVPLRLLSNTLERHMGDAYSWPNPK